MRSARLPFMLPAILSLLGGVAAGILRLGWSHVTAPATLILAHGPLMVSGFLGALIALERAVALGRPWGYSAPALAGGGAILLLLGVPAPIAGTLMTTSGLLVLAIFAVVLRRERQLFTMTMALGAACWTAGNALWTAGRPVADIVPWWLAYLIFTIAGERLELSRLAQIPDRARQAFIGIMLVLLGAIAVGGTTTVIGAPVFGIALIALAAWLLRYDIARRTMHQHGLTRFTAICMLSGYTWLAAAGSLAIAYGPVAGGFGYDAVLHAVFLGFVFAMIFGHAPIIFPAVLGIPIPFRSGFYAHLVLLHVSLLVRIGGDIAGSLTLRRWGGVLNAAAIALFLIATALSVRQAMRQRRHSLIRARQQRASMLQEVA